MKHKKKIPIININNDCIDCPRETTVIRKWTDSRPAQFIRHSLWLILTALVLTALIISLSNEYQIKNRPIEKIYQNCENGVQYPKVRHALKKIIQGSWQKPTLKQARCK